MKKRLLSLAAVMALLLGLCITPAFATGDMGKAWQTSTISTGYGFSAVVDENGSLWMWGRNGRGQVGNGGVGDSTYRDYFSFYNLGDRWENAPLQTVPVKVLDNVVSVSCGDGHTAAIKSDGSLWMWGENCHGELGNGGIGNASYEEHWYSYSTGEILRTISLPYQTVPVKVMDDVVAVSCGMDYTAAIKTDGTLWMWGNNQYGTLGNGERAENLGGVSVTTVYSDVPIKILDYVAAVSCGARHAAAIKTDGTLWMWGYNSVGAFGTGKVSTVHEENVQTVPIKVLDNVSAVSCGFDYSVAVLQDGSIWSAGDNSWGQLGTNDQNYRNTWTPTVSGAAYQAVNCGYFHVAAITDGRLYAWGSNNEGELGTGVFASFANFGGFRIYFDTAPRFVGMSVGGFEEVAAVSCGRDQTLAIKTDGTVWAWGYNYDKSLGNGGLANGNDEDSTIQTVPSQIQGIKARLPGGFTPTGSGATIPTPPAVGGFTDVKEGDYFADAVVWAVGKNITNGTTLTTFSPGKTCTNAEILTFLWRAAGKPSFSSGLEVFFDLKPDQWYTEAILWATEKGMIDRDFQLDAPCTRSSAVKYIWQAKGSPNPVAPSTFTDVPAGADYSSAVAWAIEAGVTKGTGDGKFSPADTCTRGQIVTFLHRAMG